MRSNLEAPTRQGRDLKGIEERRSYEKPSVKKKRSSRRRGGEDRERLADFQIRMSFSCFSTGG